MNRVLKWAWGAIILFLALTAAKDLWAMPTFARTYRTSCVTCHESFPRRNATGETFRMNGFRFDDDETYRKQEPVELGDEAYERLWPRSVWPSTLPSQMPLSLMARFMAELDMDGSRDDSLSFLFPKDVEVLCPVTLGDNISFYGDIIFEQKNFDGNKTETWAKLKAWIEFQDLIGPERSVNLRVGSVGTESMGLFTAQNENSVYTDLYLYTKWMMPDIEVEKTRLTDFQGNPFSIGPQLGLEINGRGNRWMYVVGLAVGNVENNTNYKAPEDDIFFVGAGDDTGAQDVFFQCAYKIGGIGFDGSGAQVENPLTAQPEFWRDDSFILSLFGYKGTAEIEIMDSLGDTWIGDDDFWRLALGFQQKYNDLTFGAGYIIGVNDNPYGYLSSESVDSRSWFVEASYFVYPWLLPYSRYEALDLDLPDGIDGLKSDQDSARFVFGCRALIRANVALNVESTYYVEGEDLDEYTDNTLFVLLNVSF
mgnify:CR=1 FL=1